MDKPETLRISPARLHRFAAAYFGIDQTAFGSSPVDRLQKSVGAEDINAVVKGFHTAALEMNTPTEQEVLGLALQGQLSILTLPCLAGLAQIQGGVPWRTPDQIRRAGAMYFCAYNLLPRQGLIYPSADYDNWVQDSCEHQATRGIIADVYTRYVPVAWKASPQPPAWLAHASRDQNIARLIVLPLLKKLPVRSSHLYSLQRLLYAALKFFAPSELQTIFQAKTEMLYATTKQRVHWLAAGLLVDADSYAATLSEYVEGNQYRTECLVRAIDALPRDGQAQPSNSALQLMIRLIGPYFTPGPPSRPASHRRAQLLVRSAIKALADWPTEKAYRILLELAGDSKLDCWRLELLAAARHLLDTLSSEHNLPRPTEA